LSQNANIKPIRDVPILCVAQRGRELVNWPIQANVCPGLFYGTPAQDGYLMRIRVPGGRLSQAQGQFLAQLLGNLGSGSAPALIQVTNRANLQVRGLDKAPPSEILQTLQHLGLAAVNPQVDHLRNLMASPTAGIDPQDLLDTTPLVQALDAYIQRQPQLADLPAKFSIGIDGGGNVGIGTRSPRAWEHRYNEIQLSAVRYPAPDGHVYLRLALGADKQLLDTQRLIPPEACVSVVAALANVYLEYLKQLNPDTPALQKCRMKHLLKDWGIDRYLAKVNQHLAQPLWHVPDLPDLLPTQPYGHMGVQPQRQQGFSFVGVSFPLGQLSPSQLTILLELAARFGDGRLRLTPWQTVLLANISNPTLPTLISELAQVGFTVGTLTAVSRTAENLIADSIIACAGKPGCAAAATQTQVHARRLADHLQHQLALDTPVNIHFTGCSKSCAQASPAEITLLGTSLQKDAAQMDSTQEDVEAYQVYLGDQQQSLKYPLGEVMASQVPFLIEQLLRQYQQCRISRDESFPETIQRLFATTPEAIPALTGDITELEPPLLEPPKLEPLVQVPL
jgi:ferredoxin-nitrite reductase